jgi:putative FmdB family regulatory protein
MPIYEYRRPDGTTFDIQQSFSDEPLAVDPETGVPVERVLHAPAVHFKGKGFYNTDYGTRNRQRESAAAAADKKSSSSDGSGADSSGSSSGEGKSAKPSEKKSEKDTKSSSSGKDSKPLAAKG